MDRRYTGVAAIVVAFLMVGGVTGVLLSQGSSSEGSIGRNDVASTQDQGLNDISSVMSDTDASTPDYGPRCGCPDPCKDEPLVHTELVNGLPFSPFFGPYPSPVFGEPTLGQINTWVEKQADAAHVGIMVQFIGLSNDEVYVNTTTADGRTYQVNLNNDATGCYGMLMDDPTTISKKMGWTWMYTGRCVAEYHNISISVTVYKLGLFQLKTYACDQDIGKRISDTQIYNFTVKGTGGKYHDQAYMFDHVVTGTTYDFTPGNLYHFNFTDIPRTARYDGWVVSSFGHPYFENVWMVNDDGTLTKMEKDAYGLYSWRWYHTAGLSNHTAHLIIQLGVEGGGPYPYSSCDYAVFDEETGFGMSHVNGMSHHGIQIYLQSL